MATTMAAPRWDLSFLFTSPDSPEFDLACENCYSELNALGATFEKLGIQKGSPDANAGATFDQAAKAFNDYLLQQRRVTVFLHGLVTTESTNEVAQAKQSEFQARTTQLS